MSEEKPKLEPWMASWVESGGRSWEVVPGEVQDKARFEEDVNEIVAQAMREAEAEIRALQVKADWLVAFLSKAADRIRSFQMERGDP